MIVDWGVLGGGAWFMVVDIQAIRKAKYYITSDGQKYVSVKINMYGWDKLLDDNITSSSDDIVKDNILCRYLRKSMGDDFLKVSLNLQAITEVYGISNFQQLIPLVGSISCIKKIISGERAITTISYNNHEYLRVGDFIFMNWMKENPLEVK